MTHSEQASMNCLPGGRFYIVSRGPTSMVVRFDAEGDTWFAYIDLALADGNMRKTAARIKKHGISGYNEVCRYVGDGKRP